jgi:hypothetical protein
LSFSGQVNVFFAGEERYRRSSSRTDGSSNQGAFAASGKRSDHRPTAATPGDPGNVAVQIQGYQYCAVENRGIRRFVSRI